MGDNDNNRVTILQNSAKIVNVFLIPAHFDREDLIIRLKVANEAEENALLKQLVMDAVTDCIDSGRFGKALKEKVEAIKEHAETRSLFWKSEFNQNHVPFFGLESKDFDYGPFYDITEEEKCHRYKPVALNEKERGFLKQAVETKLMDSLSSFMARHKALSLGHFQSTQSTLYNSNIQLGLLKAKWHSILTESRDKNKSVISILEKLINHQLNSIVGASTEQFEQEMKTVKRLNMKMRLLELQFTALVISEGEKSGEAMQLFKQNLENRIVEVNQQLNNLKAKWEAYQKLYENPEYKSVAKEYVKFQKANKQNEIALKELFL